MKKMNNILYLTTVGVISSITPTSSNAQTFYQCLPVASASTCEMGKYLENGTCKLCPAGYYCQNNQKYECADGYYQDATAQSSCRPCTGSYSIEETCKLARHYSYSYGAGGCYDGNESKNYAIKNQSKTISYGDVYHSPSYCNSSLYYDIKGEDKRDCKGYQQCSYDFIKTYEKSAKLNGLVLYSDIYEEAKNLGGGSSDVGFKLTCNKKTGVNDGVLVYYTLVNDNKTCASGYSLFGGCNCGKIKYY
ncbi:MAG: hypothetical protein ACI4N3_03495 [Alphaproteobacteria bacterium]